MSGTLPDTIGTKSPISYKPKYGKRVLKEYWERQKALKEEREKLQKEKGGETE